MLLPAMGFITGVLFFGVAGALVLRFAPSLRLSIRNLAVFVVSANVAAVGSAALLRLVTGPTLESRLTVLLYLAAVAALGVAGGVAGVVTLVRWRAA